MMRQPEELKQWEKDYEGIDIPQELEFVVRQTIRNEEKKMKRNKKIGSTLATAAAILFVFTGIVNLSPKTAYALSEMPVVGSLVKLVTVKDLTHQEAGFDADVKVPAVEGITDLALEKSLNEKYLTEETKLYEDFLRQMGEMKKINAENLSLSSSYQVITDNDKLLVVKRIHTTASASGYEQALYDTIDKQNKIILTLPGLFKDDRYISLISKNIKDQMRAQMNADPSKTYFLNESDSPDPGFESIKKDQSFYINGDGKLVIAFDEYEVAPGSMGLVEFVIPTEVIQADLVGNGYIH